MKTTLASPILSLISNVPGHISAIHREVQPCHRAAPGDATQRVPTATLEWTKEGRAQSGRRRGGREGEEKEGKGWAFTVGDAGVN